MSNTNNNDNSAVMAIGAVAAWLYCLAMAFFAILVFGALVLTLLAIYGQYRPLILNGQHITSEECERFIDRGVLGGFLLAAFVYFCQLMFDLEIDWNHYYLHIWIFGYALGSLGIELLSDETPSQTAQILPPSLPAPAAKAEEQKPEQSPQSFTFASWDDEEELP